ncbi:hypothetical protein Efla_005919 [Eimeria flavescens]
MGFVSRTGGCNAANKQQRQQRQQQQQQWGSMTHVWSAAAKDLPFEAGRCRRQQPTSFAPASEFAQSLYTRVHQQEPQPPTDDGLLQHLVAPPNREHYVEALRQISRSSYLSHLQRPVLPLDLRPWLQYELQREEKKLASLSHLTQQQLQHQASSGSSSSSPSGAHLQRIQDERIAVLQQIQYLKERIYAMELLLAERQAPPLLLHMIRKAAEEASQPQHRGSGPAAVVLAAAASAEGGSRQAADPLAATVAATEAADFPVTVPPAAVSHQQLEQLRRMGVVPSWLLGKGLGSLARPEGLKRQADELAGFTAAGWAEEFPLMQQLPGETSADAAARRVHAAAARLFGGYGMQESPLSFKQRMQQLLEQEQANEDQGQQQQQRHHLPATSPAAMAAGALQLQEEARLARLPFSVLQLLSRYAHQRPGDMVLRGSPAENAELVQKAASDLQQLFSRMAASAAASLPQETEDDVARPWASRQVGGAEADPMQRWVDQQHKELRKKQREEEDQEMETASLTGDLPADPPKEAGQLEASSKAQPDSVEAREKRVAHIVQKASALLFQRATECLGSKAVSSSGCRVFPGMLVKGRVVRVSRQSAILDIGVGCDALLQLKDVLLPLEPEPRGGLRQLLKEGDTLHAIVSVASAKELRVSLLPLRRLAAWEVLARAAQTQETLVATKQQAIAGGLVVRVLGVQGFLPASHLCDASLLQQQSPLQKHMQPLIVQVLHADVARRRLLVSQRLPMSRTELMLRKVAPGDIVTGFIVDMHPFGCVVEFGSSRALLHVSEISHLAVDTTLLFSKGETIRALVKSYDPVTGKIWLSTKSLEAYPGQMLREKQKVFAEAEAAATQYKKQQEKIQQLQEAAAKQLLRSLGMDAEQAEANQLTAADHFKLPESNASLWWGLKKDSKLLQFLEQRLQEQRQREAADEKSRSLAGDTNAEAFEAEPESETVTQLPGGGAVRVRVLRDEDQEENASVLAAAAEEALQIKNALLRSKIILRGNWQVPKRMDQM